METYDELSSFHFLLFFTLSLSNRMNLSFLFVTLIFIISPTGQCQVGDTRDTALCKKQTQSARALSDQYIVTSIICATN